MPSIACDQVVLDNLYEQISKSVVTLKRYTGCGNHALVNFGTGFIIYSTRSQVLVCIHQTVIKSGEEIFVYFSDGTSCKAHPFIRRAPSGHAVLSVEPGNCHRYPVSFSEAKVTREEICTIAQIKHDGELGMMSGIVVAPCCKTVLRSGRVVTRGERRFALTCAAGRLRNVKDSENLIGAGVFNLDGLLVGTIDSFAGVYGLKFGMHSSCFLNELERLIQDINKKISLPRGGTTLSRHSKVQRVAGKGSREDDIDIAAGKRVKYTIKLEEWCRGSPR
ncbi:uncharacterized protein LOC102700079 [Oryza brachyantha]|uniref:uncharacterized protein LOC102700079 n=1 Tax=Oryza brachyantha TaxID=4533 RepID=UPI0007766E7E|nr:uncharacterized protein LOC102700079 [Oryza brachyantha]